MTGPQDVVAVEHYKYKRHSQGKALRFWIYEAVLKIQKKKVMTKEEQL